MDFWKDRRYIDGWAVVHVLNGFVAGWSALKLLETDLVVAFFALTIVFILWEVLEYYSSVREMLSNALVDILVGLIGVCIAWFVPGFGWTIDVAVFTVGMSTLLLLVLWGFIEYQMS